MSREVWRGLYAPTGILQEDFASVLLTVGLERNWKRPAVLAALKNVVARGLCAFMESVLTDPFFSGK